MPTDSSEHPNSANDMPRLTLDVPQVAQSLGISRTLAYDLVKQGALPGVWLTPRRVVVPIDAVRRLIEGRSHQVLCHLHAESSAEEGDRPSDV